MSARPYPFERLPRLSREDVERLGRWSRAAPWRALSEGAGRAREMLGQPVTIRVGSPEPGRALPAVDAARPTLLWSGASEIGMTLDPTLAAAIVELTLGGAIAEHDAATGPLGELERGVLAYAFGRWLAPSPWRLADVFAHPAALHALMDAPIRWSAEIAIGPLEGRADLWLPRDAAPTTRRSPPAWSRDLPIALVLDAGDATLTARDLAALRPGDVLVPDRLGVAHDASGLRGHARLGAVHARWGIACVIEAGEARVARRADRNTPMTARLEESMSDEASTLEAMGDTPVQLTVELARMSVPLGELAALAPGAVLRTGQALGAPVQLRAGDRVIGAGELVEVEGELGIRLTALEVAPG
ncbi:MAG: hypothetical protein SangKO_022460 [Sandaracinaceae bacterium]